MLQENDALCTGVAEIRGVPFCRWEISQTESPVPECQPLAGFYLVAESKHALC